MPRSVLLFDAPVEVHVLDDGAFPFPAHMFFANVPQAQWHAQVPTGAEGKISVGHNHGLVKTAQELIVIDTGYGADTHEGRTGHVLDALRDAGYAPAQVTRVVITHAHGDHIKGNTRLEGGVRRPTFPNARYHLARSDWDWFTGPGHVPEFDEQVVTLQQQRLLDLMDGETRLTPEVLLIPTPGHTPGHTSVLVETPAGGSVIFLGDTAHHPLHFSHPGWVSAFDTHPALTPRSRGMILDLAIARDALLVCPHLPFPGTGRVKRAGDGFAWQPASPRN